MDTNPKPTVELGIPHALIGISLKVFSSIVEVIEDYVRSALAVPLVGYHLWASALAGDEEPPPAPTYDQALQYFNEARSWFVEGAAVAVVRSMDWIPPALVDLGTPAGAALRSKLNGWLLFGMTSEDWQRLTDQVSERYRPETFAEDFTRLRCQLQHPPAASVAD